MNSILRDLGKEFGLDIDLNEVFKEVGLKEPLDILDEIERLSESPVLLPFPNADFDGHASTPYTLKWKIKDKKKKRHIFVLESFLGNRIITKSRNLNSKHKVGKVFNIIQ